MALLDVARNEAVASRLVAQLPAIDEDSAPTVGLVNDVDAIAIDDLRKYDLDAESVVGLSEAPADWKRPGPPEGWDPTTVHRYKEAPPFPTYFKHNPGGWDEWVLRPSFESRSECVILLCCFIACYDVMMMCV
jgi:hypothetical protein